MKIKNFFKAIYLRLRSLLLNIFIQTKEIKEINPGSVTSIVVVRIDRIGDMIVSLPAISALKSLFSHAKLAVLAHPQNISLLKNIPWLDEVIAYQGFMGSIRSLRKRNFYMAVDLLMDYTIKTALISFFSKAALLVGFNIEARAKLFNIKLKPSEAKKQMSSHLLDLVRLLARFSQGREESVQESDPRLYLSEQDKSFLEEFFKNQDIKREDTLFGFAPGAKFPSQCWPIENFAKLADKIRDKYKAKIIILGSIQEERLIKSFVSLIKNKPIEVVEFPLDKLAAVISKTDLLICNNSGPLHIAAALGVPTVSTMGPTDHYLWWPAGRDNIVIRKELPCSPCNRAVCRSHECMQLITVEEMEKAVDIQMEKIGDIGKIMNNLGKMRLAIEPKEIKEILVINLGGIGDVLISTPALRALKSCYKEAELCLLVVGRVSELVKDLAYVEKVYIFEINHPWLHAFANLKTLLELRGRKIDLAINMRTLVSKASALKIKSLLDIINPRIKAGRDTARRGSFFNIAIPEEDIGEKYEMDYDIEIVEALGAKVTDKQIDFKIRPERVQKIQELLERSGVDTNDILIGIHPGGKPSHRLAMENFVEVMSRLQRETPCKFFITGGKDEVNLANRIIEMSQVKAINLAGKLGLQELGALLKRCNLYISNDTGVMHIAAIMKTPQVAIFGPGYICRYDPRNISHNAIVLYKEADCAPCTKITCESMKCLKTISAQEIVQAALSLLRRK